MKNNVCVRLMVILMVGLFPAWSMAEDHTVAITITSDSMSYDPDKNQVSFVGNVHVVRQDFQLWSEQLMISFGGTNHAQSSAAPSSDPGSGQALSQITTIIALTNVRLESKGKKGYCGKATYFQHEELVQLEDEPRLEEGKNHITGAIIKLSLRDNSSEILGGEKRVQAVFFSSPGQVE